MERKHREILRKNRMALLDDLDIESGLTDYMLSEGLITDAVKEKLLLPHQTRLKKAGEFIDVVQKRGPKAFDTFYDGLKYTEQYHLADVLKPELAPCQPRPDSTSQPSTDQSARVGGTSDYNRQLSVPTQDTDTTDNRLNIDAIQDGAWPLNDHIEIKVIPTREALLQRLRSKSQNYTMSANPRGRAVIINNEKFGGKLGTRTGTNIDCYNIQMLFEQLHFQVSVHRNKTAEQIKSILNKEKDHPGHSTSDCFVLIVLSHGENDAVFGTDEKLVAYSELYGPFDGNQCKNLKGKPKLFIIQACQGTKLETTARDASDGFVEELRKVSKEMENLNMCQPSGDQADASPFQEETSLSKQDIIFATATFPEYISWRNEDYGSWFVRAIVEVFQDYACEDDLLELLRKVRNLVAKRKHVKGHRQTTTDKLSTLTKKLYFYPEASF